MSGEISLDEYKKAYRQMEVERKKKVFSIHLAVYVLVNAILIAINLIYSPNTFWFYYPLVGWGIGIIAHYLGAVRWIESKLKKKEAEAEYRARESKRK
jgi:hypothetical protein